MIAGSGTIGLEIWEDLPDVEAVVIPFGGGGLSCGIASALRALKPDTRIYACEVETVAPLAASLAAGTPQEVQRLPSFVDGIGAPVVLQEMWPLASELLVPHLPETCAAWWTLTFAEAYAYHEPNLRQHLELYSPATRQSILIGLLLTATDYLQAQRLRSLIQVECAAALTEVDAVIVPCTIAPAPVVEDWDHFTPPSFTSLWSLLGYPALSLGCGFSSEALPIGMQIVGKPLKETKLLGIGDVYQRLSDWHTHLPKPVIGRI